MSAQLPAAAPLVALAAVALTAACTAPALEPEPDPPRTSIDFWDGVSVTANEVDPPGNLHDLAARSPLIVLGTIEAVEDVAAEVSGLGEGAPTVALEIAVAETIEGEEATHVTAVRPRDPLVTTAELHGAIPPEDVLFFLTPAGYEGFYATSSSWARWRSSTATSSPCSTRPSLPTWCRLRRRHSKTCAPPSRTPNRAPRPRRAPM